MCASMGYMELQECYDLHQSYRMDPYVVLTHSYGLQGAFGYWVQPVRDGSTGYIQLV